MGCGDFRRAVHLCFRRSQLQIATPNPAPKVQNTSFSQPLAFDLPSVCLVEPKGSKKDGYTSVMKVHGAISFPSADDHKFLQASLCHLLHSTVSAGTDGLPHISPENSTTKATSP